MSSATIGRRLGNSLYRAAFPIYRPLYSAFKAHADRAERQLLAAVLADGSVAVDAGANIGIYSEFLSRCVGPTGEVHSFEPAPDNFARLSSAMTKLPNVHVNQCALGAETGEQLLYLSKELNVDHRLYPAQGEKRRTFSVRVLALDDYFNSGGPVDLIKLDIQGYELHALRGAARLLGNNPRIKLLLEFWPYGLCQAGSSPEELLEFLRQDCFSVFSVSQNGKSRFTYSANMDGDPFFYINLFAERDE